MVGLDPWLAAGNLNRWPACGLGVLVQIAGVQARQLGFLVEDRRVGWEVPASAAGPARMPRGRLSLAVPDSGPGTGLARPVPRRS